MTNLTFTKNESGEYVATTSITDKCALHIERESEGRLLFEQSHVQNGKYAEVKESVGVTLPQIVDIALVDPAEAYPVYLRITSQSKVTSACLMP